jgi:predicted ATPase
MHIRRLRILHEAFPPGDCYPFHLPFLRLTPVVSFSSPVTFFIGENGTGKSTLLRALARRCGIHIWQEPEGHRVRYNRHEGELYRYLDVEWTAGKVPGAFFASEIFSHFTRLLDDWAASDPGLLEYFGNESLMTKSHGQCHMSFFSSRFRIAGMYLLDEPENALSPRRQLELISMLREIAATGRAQFIIATHSPILLAMPGAEILSFDRAPLEKVLYEETDYYTIYRDFLNHRERYLGDG